MPGLYTFDLTTLIILIPSLIFAMVAQGMVKSAFSKYDKMATRRGVTGEAAVQIILRTNGIDDVAVEPISGQLTDHFDPRKKVIRLSEPVFQASSVSAVGVAAHEAGHAVQYANGYVPMKIRHAIIPITNLSSKMATPLIIIGIIMSYGFVLNVGIALFSIAFLFQLVTLPVEFNASRRALASLESQHILNEEELVGAKKVLRAAALTYVAALAVTLSQLTRLLTLSNRRNSR